MALPHDDYLPGVGGRDLVAPTSICDVRSAIRKARRRAMLSDALDLTLLLAVDIVFVRWGAATLPFLSRFASLGILVAANAALIGSCVLARKFPEWRARRISATWSPKEQSRSHLG
jgi:hypothetical protein